MAETPVLPACASSSKLLPSSERSVKSASGDHQRDIRERRKCKRVGYRRSAVESITMWSYFAFHTSSHCSNALEPSSSEAFAVILPACRASRLGTAGTARDRRFRGIARQQIRQALL